MKIICTSLNTDDRAITKVFAGRMLFLMPNQQRQSTEGSNILWKTWMNN